MTGTNRRKAGPGIAPNGETWDRTALMQGTGAAFGSVSHLAGSHA